MKNLFRLLCIIFLCAPLFFPLVVQAADDRWYQYNRIDTVITINQDTSFDVSETQTYLFHGVYHQGYREIPFRKIDAVTSVRVFDEMGKPLSFSRRRLEKTDPNSWGKYTTFPQNGNQVIEWYYDAKDEKRTWRLDYRIVGGLEFLRDTDRLYWNLFTNYSVPVVRASVTVVPPTGALFSDEKLTAYRTTSGKQMNRVDNYSDRSVTFQSEGFGLREAFTVDVEWPKGFVDRAAYWWMFIRLHYGYIGAVIVALAATLVGIFYWLKHEKLPQSRLTTVPQYKPPKNLRPAVAEIVVKETLTPKGMAATIVDLAVRGYLTIEETKIPWLNSSTAGGCLFILIIVGILLMVFNSVFSISTAVSGIFASVWTTIMAVLLILKIALRFRIMPSFSSNYLVRLKKPLDVKLTEMYERDYVELLTGGKDFFTTDELRRSTDKQLHQNIQKLKDSIYSHAHVSTKAFVQDPLLEKYKWITWMALFFVGIFIVSSVSGIWMQVGILVGSVVFSSVGLWAFLRFETRLSREGMVLKDEWLGFKMFLETAEKGEHARAKPDMFPRYLPYAMIFGVEKKWAKAFEGMNIPNQTWYVGGGFHGGGSGSFSSGSGGFSGFSASFSSSFASAFASSAGGGGSGGGGGAGGGGGGGGGGAS